MTETKSKKTKIVATLGPASDSRAVIKQLIHAGANVFRLNFSHGDHNVTRTVINNIEAVREEMGVNVAILADLQGPKIRLGMVNNEGVKVRVNDVIKLTSNISKSDPFERIFHIKFDSLAKDVKVGDVIKMDDGKLELQVIDNNNNNTDTIELKVLNNGTIRSNKGVNMPDTDLSIASLSEKDLKDLEFILEQPFDWIALSFVRSAADIKDLRKRIREKNGSLKVIAKIERPEAISRIDEVISASDAIMIARGDLGVEIPFEQVPLEQKKIVTKCIYAAKPVIIATQVLESMIENPKPLRAEVSDIANAVLEGVDAIMVSGETSVGKYPVEVVETIAKTINETENYEGLYDLRIEPDENSPSYLADSVCFNAARTAHFMDAHAIVAMTKSGFTAFKLASYRPGCGIYIFTDNRNLLNQLSLVWGVESRYYDGAKETDVAMNDINYRLKEEGIVKEDDIVINTASMPVHSVGRTNMIKLTVIE